MSDVIMLARLKAAVGAISRMDPASAPEDVTQLIDAATKLLSGITFNDDLCVGFYIGMAWALDGCPGLAEPVRSIAMKSDYDGDIGEVQ
jgi:hypothetical protein